MKNINFPKSYHKRRFLKIVGFAIIGSCGYGAYSYLNNNNIKSTWSGSVLNAPAKLEIHGKTSIKVNQLLVRA